MLLEEQRLHYVLNYNKLDLFSLCHHRWYKQYLLPNDVRSVQWGPGKDV